ncbi:MAG: hypothetical protein HKO05_04580 [Erythrobacter sp.]|jgi:hypothetical protein|nr:hypothetical protein [Erythrobacter sp.]
MEFAKRITIFFAAMTVVALPLAAQTAKRGAQPAILDHSQELRESEARAAAAVATLAGLGLALMLVEPEEE